MIIADPITIYTLINDEQRLTGAANIDFYRYISRMILWHHSHRHNEWVRNELATSSSILHFPIHLLSNRTHCINSTEIAACRCSAGVCVNGGNLRSSQREGRRLVTCYRLVDRMEHTARCRQRRLWTGRQIVPFMRSFQSPIWKSFMRPGPRTVPFVKPNTAIHKTPDLSRLGKTASSLNTIKHRLNVFDGREASVLGKIILRFVVNILPGLRSVLLNFSKMYPNAHWILSYRFCYPVCDYIGLYLLNPLTS